MTALAMARAKLANAAAAIETASEALADVLAALVAVELDQVEAGRVERLTRGEREGEGSK